MGILTAADDSSLSKGSFFRSLILALLKTPRERSLR